MTTQAVSIELEPRTVLGKKVKTLRRAGIIPVNIYGAGMESRAMQCEERPLLRALNAAGGEEGQPMRLTVGGESTQFVARAADIQWAPRTGGILHVDFQTVTVQTW